MNVRKLKGLLVEKGISLDYVATAIGVGRSTFYRKLQNGGDSFTIGEVTAMANKIPLSKDEISNIFFSDLCQSDSVSIQGGTQ